MVMMVLVMVPVMVMMVIMLMAMLIAAMVLLLMMMQAACYGTAMPKVCVRWLGVCVWVDGWVGWMGRWVVVCVWGRRKLRGLRAREETTITTTTSSLFVL